MCIPKSSARKQQTKTASNIPKTDTKQLSATCSKQPAKEPRPTLVNIVVTDANSLGNDTYWAAKDAVRTVSVRAVTNPDDQSGWDLLTWTGASSVSPDKRDATIARGSVGDVTVSARIDAVTKSANIEIYDLVSLDCPLPNGKGYLSDNATTRLKAVTNPDEAKVWKHLTWSEGTPTSGKNEDDAALKPVGKRSVSVTLGTKSLSTDVKVCQWPRLEIKEITFEGHEVLNDGLAEIDQPFDKKWVKGRKEHAVNEKTSDVQSPLCFTQGKKIKLQAKFEVVDKATEDEDVKVEAMLGFGKLEGTVKVTAGASEASLATTQSSATLPKTVDAEASWTITWKHLDHDGTTWLDADQSKHRRYVLLGDPKEKVYLTLLDVSCVAAKGKGTADDLVTESFKPFVAAKGTGKGFKRRGDGVEMSYYNKGVSTATGNAVQTTSGMLGSADGTGRCGGWATLLGHMWKMHGVTSTKRWYIRATDKALMNFDLRFLVKNCTFNGAGTRPNGAYSHEGAPAKNEVQKQEGIPGHGQNNPQFDFGDHVVVKYGGKLYDPSYGVGPYSDDDTYLAAALDGLGKWPKVTFTFKGVDQHMPQECIAYGDGFAEYTIVNEPFEFFAQSKFKATGAALWSICKFYDATGSVRQYPATPADVPPGMLVKVALSTGPYWEEMSPKMTLSDIALKHGKTQDQIFDHPKNAAVKAKRTKKENLETGDVIIVSKALDPDCWLVVGHDL